MTLRSQHKSTINNRIRPDDMDTTKIPSDMRKMIENESLSIFTAMTNAGASLQQTLAAVFLSGMSMTKALEKA